MNIVVCLKQVLDPDVPARDFKIDPGKREATRGSANLVTSIFCANALETALQFRDAFGGKITALSFGTSAARRSCVRRSRSRRTKRCWSRIRAFPILILFRLPESWRARLRNWAGPTWCWWVESRPIGGQAKRGAAR